MTGLVRLVQFKINDFLNCLSGFDLEILNDLYSSEAIHTGENNNLIEIVNPSGTKNFKKGLYFLMMYEDNIKVKNKLGNYYLS